MKGPVNDKLRVPSPVSILKYPPQQLAGEEVSQEYCEGGGTTQGAHGKPCSGKRKLHLLIWTTILPAAAECRQEERQLSVGGLIPVNAVPPVQVSGVSKKGLRSTHRLPVIGGKDAMQRVEKV